MRMRHPPATAGGVRYGQRPRRNADHVQEELNWVDDISMEQEILAERKTEEVEVGQQCPEEVQLIMKGLLRGHQRTR